MMTMPELSNTCAIGAQRQGRGRTTKKQAEARARLAMASWGSSSLRRNPSQNHSAMLSPGCCLAITQILGLPGPGCPAHAASAAIFKLHRLSGQPSVRPCPLCC